MATCPVCQAAAQEFGHARILGDRDATYLRCGTCRCVFLPEPDWLEQAYSSAISALDVGLVERCLQLANVTTAVLAAQKLRGGTFLDFAGGYGTLTRLMRDRGAEFRHMDPFCDNVFAKGFDATLDRRYDLVTAFEVLEHLPDPAAALAPVADRTDFLLMTTQVLPEPAPQPGHWDYFAEETGQHIVFYTVDGLRVLADRLGMQVTTSGRLVHLLHRRPLRPATRLLLRDERIAYVWGALKSERARRRGLISADRQAAVVGLRESAGE